MASKLMYHRPYVSGPMTGIAFHNFPLFFEVGEKLRARGSFPQNPATTVGTQPGSYWANWEDAFNYAVANPQTWHEYIHKDMMMLCHSDSVVLLPGWEKSKGACLEVVAAVCMGYPIALWADGTLVDANLKVVYANALNHLVKCGLEGVQLTPEGFAEYVS